MSTFLYHIILSKIMYTRDGSHGNQFAGLIVHQLSVRGHTSVVPGVAILEILELEKFAWFVCVGDFKTVFVPGEKYMLRIKCLTFHENWSSFIYSRWGLCYNRFLRAAQKMHKKVVLQNCQLPLSGSLVCPTYVSFLLWESDCNKK